MLISFLGPEVRSDGLGWWVVDGPEGHPVLAPSERCTLIRLSPLLGIRAVAPVFQGDGVELEEAGAGAGGDLTVSGVLGVPDPFPPFPGDGTGPLPTLYEGYLALDVQDFPDGAYAAYESGIYLVGDGNGWVLDAGCSRAY